MEDGLLKSKEFINSLIQFNNWTMKEGNELSEEQVLKAIQLWMEGQWYHEIAEDLNTEVYKVIRLINSLIGYNLQTIASSVIRIKIAKDEDYEPDPIIFNWPLFLQYGIDSMLKLSLFELGLTDRVAVLHLSKLLQNIEIEEEELELTTLLLNQEKVINEELQEQMPLIAFQKIKRLIDLLKFR